jgi:Polyketide cyclase / dehydrase and lipid transport
MMSLDRPASDDSQVAVASEIITVEFPIGDVFDFLADGSSNPLWRPEVTNVIFAAGPAERAVWAQSVRNANGRVRKADYRVTDYDRPGTLEQTVVNGPSRPTTLFSLKSLGASSTQVTCMVDVKPLLWPFATTRLGSGVARAAVANILNLPAAMAGSGRSSR